MTQPTPAAPTPRDIQRIDSSDDAEFYNAPRLVVHIDTRAIAAVTEQIRRLVRPGADVLDLMSSYRSHLPPELPLTRVVGVGMNADELWANSQLDEWLVQDLNRDPRLPFPDRTFDAALCIVSVQYMTRPIEQFAEVARVVRPGAPFLVAFSNRCFPTKAIRAWRERDDAGHVELVRGYFDASGAWDAPQTATHRPHDGDPLYAVWGERRRQ